jgi:hypothetical protein
MTQKCVSIPTIPILHFSLLGSDVKVSFAMTSDDMQGVISPSSCVLDYCWDFENPNDHDIVCIGALFLKWWISFTSLPVSYWILMLLPVNSGGMIKM